MIGTTGHDSKFPLDQIQVWRLGRSLETSHRRFGRARLVVGSVAWVGVFSGWTFHRRKQYRGLLWEAKVRLTVQLARGISFLVSNLALVGNLDGHSRWPGVVTGHRIPRPTRLLPARSQQKKQHRCDIPGLQEAPRHQYRQGATRVVVGHRVCRQFMNVFFGWGPTNLRSNALLKICFQSKNLSSLADHWQILNQYLPIDFWLKVGCFNWFSCLISQMIGYG